MEYFKAQAEATVKPPEVCAVCARIVSYAAAQLAKAEKTMSSRQLAWNNTSVLLVKAAKVCRALGSGEGSVK